MGANLCPSSTILNELLENALPAPEQARVTSHLETCELCQQTLEGLAAGKDVWDGAVKQLAGEQPPFETALNRAMEGMKHELTSGVIEPISLDFLQPSDSPLSIGRFGEYEIREVLGHGGMGIVLLGFDVSLQREVAIKVLAPQLAAHATARKRFKREAQAAATVNHENVVRIHAVGEAQGLPYFVMELVPGLSLQQMLDRDGPPPLPTLLVIAKQIVSGLAAAHAQGLIHRDIKPANILIRENRDAGAANRIDFDGPGTSVEVKITDFGLARAVDGAALTQAGVITGTPQYMAPEQARGEVLDHRADLFSLGGVLYALCTGKPPFEGDNPFVVLRKVCEESPVPISEINPLIPGWIRELVVKLMMKNPVDRLQTAREIGAWLEQKQAPLSVVTEIDPLRDKARPLVETSKKGATRMPLTKCPDCGKDVSDNAVACPHCGRRVSRDYEYRSSTELFGVPLVHIANGIDPITGRFRVARGIIAIGNGAIGVVAIGGWAVGGIAIGGGAVGLIALGGFSLGLLLALGGMAVGGVAIGGLSVGLIAVGGGAFGYYALGGDAWGAYAYGGNAHDQQVLDLFHNCFGDWLDVPSRP